MKRILLIEDDQELVGLLAFHLQDEAFQLDHDCNGTEGFDKARSRKYDLIILDINLPGKNGLEICKDLRNMNCTTPILMLTARSEEIDRILGLEFGADDYVSKPFSIRELLARIKAIFRRVKLNSVPEEETSVSYLDRGLLKIDIEKRKVSVDGQIIALTPTEYSLLILLASHPGRNYSKDILLDKVWGYEFNGFKTYRQLSHQSVEE